MVKRGLLTIAVFCMLAAIAGAAVVVFKNDSVVVASSVQVKGGELVVTLADGSMTFSADQVAWHTQDDSINSLWAASQAAQKDGKPQVAVRLAREAVVKEPANAPAARELIYLAEQKASAARRASAAPAGSAALVPAGGTAAAASGSGKAAPGVAAATAPAGTEASAGSPEGETPQAGSVQTDPETGWIIEGSPLNAEDMRVGGILALIFGMIVLFSIWKVTLADG